ncbi:MAG: LamG-like jellyroll fold domain-containing protein [Bryobacteraceae bacterium]
MIDLETERSVGSSSGPPLVADTMIPSPALDHLWIDGRDACSSPSYDHLGCPTASYSVLHLYRTSDGAFVKTLGWPDEIRSITPHPDGRRLLLVLSKNEETRILVLSTIGFHVLEDASVAQVHQTAVSPDGRFIAAASTARRVSVFGAQSLDCEPPKSDLVSHWSADRTYDDAITYHLKPIGAVGFAPGIQGSAFRLGPGPAYLVRISGVPPYGFQPAGTIAAWVNPRSFAANGPIIGFTATGQPRRWQLAIAPDRKLHFELETEPTVALVSPTAVPANEWTHVALVKSRGRLALFINGRLDVTVDDANEIPLNGFTLGTDNQRASFFHGLVDEVLQYNRALNDQDVRKLYEMPRRSDCSVR